MEYFVTSFETLDDNAPVIGKVTINDDGFFIFEEVVIVDSEIVTHD